MPLVQAIDLWAYAYDEETADSGLFYSILSSTNAQAGVNVVSNRYITVNPATNWSGTSTVTVQVSDGNTTATDVFVVTVNAVNDTPVLVGLPDLSTQDDTPLVHAIDLWAFASDVETPDSSLVFTIVSSTYPQAGVALETNRYINVTPTVGWSGTSSGDDPGVRRFEDGDRCL